MSENKSAKTKNVRKKRGGCYNCCMSVLVFNFVCACIIICVGFIIGGQYTQQKLNMSLKDTFGVFSGILRAKGDVIENAYSEGDEVGFYNSVEDALMLNDGIIDKDEFVDSAVASIKNGNPQAIADYALNLIDLQNFDQSKIGSVGTDNQVDTNLTVSTKELAAFVDGVASTMIIDFLLEELGKVLPKEIDLDFEALNSDEYFKLEQLIIHDENRRVEGYSKSVDMLTVTFSLNCNQILKDSKKATDFKNLFSFNPMVEKLAPILNVLIKPAFDVVRFVLPSKLYVTFDMGISDNVQPNVYINDMDDQKMANVYRLLKTVGVDVQKELNKIFVEPDGVVAGAMNTANSKVSFDSILSDGGVNCDIYQLIIDLLSLNKDKTEDELISNSDIPMALKTILSDNTQYLEELKSSEYSYKNVEFKRNPDGSLDLSSGEPVIINQGAQYYITDGDDLDRLISDYEQLVMTRLINGYGLKSSYDLDSFINEVKDEDFDSSTGVNMFDNAKLSSIIRGEARGITITDKMVAAILHRILPDGVKKAGFEEDSVDIEFVYLEEKYLNLPRHIMHVGLRLPKDVFLSKFDDSIQNTVGGLLNETVVIETALDITLGAGVDGLPYLNTKVSFNGKSVDSLDKVLAGFKLLGLNEQGRPMVIGDIMESMLLPMRSFFENLNSMLPGLMLQSSVIKMPNVYSALSYALNQGKNETDDDYIEADVLERALKLCASEGPIGDSNSDYSFFDQSNSAAVLAYNKANEQALLDELSLKYGFSYETTGSDYTLSEVLYIMGIGNLSDSSRVEGMKAIDLIAPAKLKQLSLSDGDWQNTLKVNISNVTYLEDNSGTDMLTELVRHVMFGGGVDLSALGADFGPQDLLFAQAEQVGDRQYIVITVKTVLRNIISFSGSSIEELMSTLLPSSEAVITLTVDITRNVEPNQTELNINGDDQATCDLMTVLRSFDCSLNLSGITDTMRRAFEKFDTANHYEIGDDELLLSNVFTVIRSATFAEDEVVGDDEVKAALVSVYKTTAIQPTIVNNGISSNSISADQLVSQMLTRGYVLDNELGVFLDNTLDDTVGRVLQFNILAANPNDGSRNQEDRSWFSGRVAKSLKSDKAYFAVTLRVDVDSFSASGTSKSARLLGGEDILVTILFEQFADSFYYYDFAINDLDLRHRNILRKLAGVGNDETSIINKANACLNHINDLMSKIEATASGMGIRIEHRYIESTDGTARGRYEITQA